VSALSSKCTQIYQIATDRQTDGRTPEYFKNSQQTVKESREISLHEFSGNPIRSTEACRGRCVCHTE